MFPTLTEQDVYKLSTIPLHALGTIFYLPGVNSKKGFRYVAFGGSSTINPGLLLSAPAAPAGSTNLAINAANLTAQLSAGSRSIIITNGTTSVAVNQFADGQLEVLGVNGGQSVTIAGNSAAGNGGQITVTLAEPLTNAVALVPGTNTVNLRVSTANGAVPSLTQAEPVGVTICPVPNSASVTNYGFVQIAGPCQVAATSATKCYPVVQDTAGTAGYIANTGSNLAQIGIARESLANGFASVNLQLN
jgi:hypothetical protein